MFYNTTHMSDLIRQAFEGNEKAKEELQSIAAPCAITGDYSEMILVQDKYAVVNKKGQINSLNMQPEMGKERLQVADIYQCSKSGVSWSSIPIPCSFPVSTMVFNENKFYFVSKQNKQVGGTISQIKKAMFEVSFALDGAAKPDIERCFFSIPSTAVEYVPKKTIYQNPPIRDAMIGTLSFNEQLQQFQGEYYAKGRAFTLSIKTIERNDALKLLPIIRSTLDKLQEIDAAAKDFASYELLELKNDIWLQANERIVTRRDFIARMSITYFAFLENGAFEIWYDDGNLFEGHSITIYFNELGHAERAEING